MGIYPAPRCPVQVIPDRDLPPAPVIVPESVRVTPRAIDKDSAAGPYRAGMRWQLLVASNDLRASPDFSGLQLLS